MTWVPAFRPGIGNAWLLMIIFPLQWLAVLLLPSRIAKRTGHAREITRTRGDRVLSFLTQAVWVGATVYSVFLPLRLGTLWFWSGLALFLVGLAILVLASVRVARTPDDRPFTCGVYRFSRHPMHLSLILAYLGVCVASASWVFLLITAGTVVMQRRQMLMEEAYCRETFGDAYRAYTASTARWFGLPRKG
jgi:protein-S-isoprenylcysteine O-methyltransferase Ste14